ncbi:MAG: YgaP family membrane protein [Roseinatronobacter sp.]
MLAKNVGGIDRILRIAVGVALLLGFVLNSGASMSWLYLIGIVPLATGLMRTCPLYSVIGLNTCAIEKK